MIGNDPLSRLTSEFWALPGDASGPGWKGDVVRALTNGTTLDTSKLPADFWALPDPGPGSAQGSWKALVVDALKNGRPQSTAPAAAPVGGIGGIGGIGGGALNFSSEALNQFRDIADPFWQQRAGYQTQLSKLISNPGAMTTSPMYQFALDQGLNAVNRTAAAQHMLGSGNRLADLTKFGQGLASQQFFPMATLLSNLAGANMGNPGAALSGLTTMRGQDINAATSLYNTNANMQIAQSGGALDAAKFAYQQQQDALAQKIAQDELNKANKVSYTLPGSSISVGDMLQNSGQGLTSTVYPTGPNILNIRSPFVYA